MRLNITQAVAIAIISTAAAIVIMWFGFVAFSLVTAVRLGPAGVATEAGRLVGVYESARRGPDR